MDGIRAGRLSAEQITDNYADLNPPLDAHQAAVESARCLFCHDAPCAEACPTGARVFGNLLDPNSEIRYVLKHKKVFRLKEDLKTDPKFWYFMD